MGLPFEKLKPKKWGGETPPPVQRGPIDIGNVTIDVPVILSPMAAVTNPPFRLLCREFGAGLVVTEMIYAVGLAQRETRTMSMLDLRANEHPVSVQIYGKDPAQLAEACRVVQAAGADAVDLNMGCPMRKVVGSGHGAALLRDPENVERIFEAMSSAVDIPVTGKIRAGWEESNAIEVAQAMASGGASAVTIHGRTRCDMYDGHVDLAVIAELKKAVEIKVIGNGDVCDWVSARRMFHATGCDGVMVARGCLGNPWVFAEIKADLEGRPIPDRPTPDEIGEVLRRHVSLYVETFGEEVTTREIRKHLLWYFRDTDAEKVLRARLKAIETASDIDGAISAACSALEAERLLAA